MRLELNGLTGAVLSLVFVVCWTVADYFCDSFYPRPGHFLWLFGAMAVINGLWGAALGILYQRVRRLSITDPLTQVYNRNYLFPQADRELALARRYGYPVSVVVVDLDDFKTVNDAHGHVEGDKVLQRVAAALRGSLRRSDTIARYGGDEFVLLLPHTTKREACRLLMRVRQEWPFREISMSAGVAVHPEDGDTLEDLLRRADEAMYAAKKWSRTAAVSPSAPAAPATLPACRG